MKEEYLFVSKYEKQRRKRGRSFFASFEGTFLCKVIPTILVGFILFAMGGWLFLSTEFDLLAYIGLIALFFVAGIGAIALAHGEKNALSLAVFLPFSFLGGYLEIPTLQWAVGEVGLAVAVQLYEISVVLGVLATVGALAVGFVCHDSLREWEDEILKKLVVMGIVVIALEFVLYLVFGITDWVILLTSGLVLLWITGVVILDGSYIADARDNADTDHWMYWAISVYLDVVIYVVRIFLILVALSDRKK